MSSYSDISWPQLVAALLQRLQDVAGSWTTPTEAATYITEALRVLNSQTSAGTSGQWSVDYIFNFNAGDTWKSLNVAGSPRQRTVTDLQVETQMELMLNEPPSGLTWTGTSQFNITNLSNALQFRRDELLQMTGANPINLLQVSPTGSNRSVLPDLTLDVRRVRWIPDPTTSTQTPYALGRDDVTSANAYGNSLGITTGSPDSWRITANSPLEFDVSCQPNVPGQWDMLLLNAGPPLIPPTASILGLPDDWCWVAMYGALADCLSNSPEATDVTRSKYCRMRYERGMKAMMKLPWLLDTSVASLPCGTPSFKAMDAYAQNWENTWPADDPQIVVGGMDLVALAPFVPLLGTPVSSLLTVVGNAPVDQTLPVQLSRDAVDAVLAYAQHLAMFSTAGADFMATMPLYQQFEEYCATQNRRYAALGVFRSDMLEEGDRASDIDPRFGPPHKEVKHGSAQTR